MSKINLKQKLAAKELVIGSWISLGHTAIAEIMARAGYEWLTIDLEHSTIDLNEAQELIRTCDLLGVAPLVRLSSNDPVQIKRVMDAGATGIIVPNIKSAKDARAAVDAVYYPPRGSRGVGLARAQRYGSGFADYRKWLEENAVVVVQIEHKDAVNNLEEILQTLGVDAFLVGPYDLSGSYGEPGNFESKQFISAIAQINSIAKNSPVAPGIHIVEPNIDSLLKAKQDGYKMIAYSVDIRMIDTCCRLPFK